MNSFKDYMYYLLTTPLKKVSKIKNQFNILFDVLGKYFDNSMEILFFAREQSMLDKADQLFLPEYGKDRRMQRYNNETLENYRNRLMTKNEIAEKAGSIEGILLALKSIGYNKAFIEPYYLFDPDRWAEFIIFLDDKDDKQNEINDLGIVDIEVRKVKQASSLPSYGSIVGNNIKIYSEEKRGYSKFPLCNTIVCGVYPEKSNYGLMTSTKLLVNSLEKLDSTEYKFAATIAASEKTYQEYDYVQLIKDNSSLNFNSNNPICDTTYPICGVEITEEGAETDENIN